jgi:hypothetical protein
VCPLAWATRPSIGRVPVAPTTGLAPSAICPRIFDPFECQRAFGYVVLVLAVGMAIGGTINAAVRRSRQNSPRREGGIDGDHGPEALRRVLDSR